jgi:hypothetical protein
MERTVYEVVPLGKEWVLRRRGRRARRVFATREEAIASGREACRANRPSLLRIRKAPPDQLG